MSSFTLSWPVHEKWTRSSGECSVRYVSGKKAGIFVSSFLLLVLVDMGEDEEIWERSFYVLNSACHGASCDLWLVTFENMWITAVYLLIDFVFADLWFW